jgi:hypothetical protein
MKVNKYNIQIKIKIKTKIILEKVRFFTMYNK